MKGVEWCALAREGHSAPQAASGLPLNHVPITAASSSSASGGDEGKAWAEREQAAQTCSARWHRRGWEPGSWEQSRWVLVVTWSPYFGGVTLGLVMQLPVYVPCIHVTLVDPTVVLNWEHFCTSSVSASGVELVYDYHYPVR